MLRAIRQRVHAPAGRLVLLVLALLLWPGSAFAAMDCCPDEPPTSMATHAMDGGAADGPPCHGEVDGTVDASDDEGTHGHCDSECAARCAVPNLFTMPAVWPGVGLPTLTVVRWTARVAPSPEASQLLRPPITA